MVQPTPFQMPSTAMAQSAVDWLGQPRDVLVDDAERVDEQPVEDARLAVVEPHEDERDDDPAA